MKVLLEDAATLGYCRRGLRMVAERHGFDYSDFVFNGIDSSKLEVIDDEMVKALIEQARRREGLTSG